MVRFCAPRHPDTCCLVARVFGPLSLLKYMTVMKSDCQPASAADGSAAGRVGLRGLQVLTCVTTQMNQFCVASRIASANVNPQHSVPIKRRPGSRASPAWNVGH